MVIADAPRRRTGPSPGLGGLGESSAFKSGPTVGDADQVQELIDFTVDRFGGLQVMCNNAGVGGSRRRFLDDDLGDFDTLDAGQRLRCDGRDADRATRHMAEEGRGSIINTTSIGGMNAEADS